MKLRKADSIRPEGLWQRDPAAPCRRLGRRKDPGAIFCSAVPCECCISTIGVEEYTKTGSKRMAMYALPVTLSGLLVLAIALLVLWIIVSVPVYVAGKLITTGKGEFGDAMVATLGGAIVYVIVLFGGTLLLSFVISANAALVLSFVLALIAWVAVYANAFNTSWLGGAAIAIVGWAVLVVIDLLLISLFGVTIPKFYPF